MNHIYHAGLEPHPSFETGSMVELRPLESHLIDCPCGLAHVTPASPAPDARCTCARCGRVRAWSYATRTWNLVQGRPGVEVPPLNPNEEAAELREQRRPRSQPRPTAPSKPRKRRTRTTSKSAKPRKHTSRRTVQ